MKPSCIKVRKIAENNFKITLGERNLTLSDVVAVARSGCKVEVHSEFIKKMEPSLSWLSQVTKSGKPLVYGLNTGVGSRSKEKLYNNFQKELIYTHATGTGEYLPEDVVRATMLLLANSLIKGYSGVRPVIVETIVSMLNKKVTPLVPSKGSVGSCGDLTPLSHIALVIADSGDEKLSGEAIFMGEKMSGKEAMKKANIPRVSLEGREGLALINGPWLSMAIGALVSYDAWNLLHLANLSASLSMEALRAFLTPFYERLHKLKPHNGQIEVSREILNNLEGSTLVYSIEDVQSVEDPIEKFGKIHDSYSIRCIPQVHGAVWDTLSFVQSIIEKEINAVSDNPVILANASWQNKALSGGNPHGEHLAMTLDFLTISLTELGNICERRIYRLINRSLNDGLPSGLILENEEGSGLEILHYTAVSLASENKTLSHPASVDSIPMAEDMEDYVSMATIAASKVKRVTENLKAIIATELISAVRGIYLRRSKDESFQLGKRTNLVYKLIGEETNILKPNPILSEELKKVVELIKNETLFKRKL